MTLPLAASGIEVTIALIVAAIYWISKIVSAASSNTTKPPPRPTAPRQGGLREMPEPRVQDSEEERTRKFLEALGLPPTTLQPQARQETMRPGSAPIRRPGGVAPVPPFVPEVMRGGRGSIPHEPMQSARNPVEQARLERKRREAQEKQQRRALQPPPLPEADPKPYAGEIERIHLPELQTARVEEFHTRSSDVSAIPFEVAESVAGQLYVKAGSARQEGLIALARSPKALRQAILLREILGPPRSLQNDFAAPNLAPL